MTKSRRYRSITSVVGIVAVIVVLFVYINLVWHKLIDHEIRSDTTLTQVFSRPI